MSAMRLGQGIQAVVMASVAIEGALKVILKNQRQV
jgi:hypothetical protein